MKETVTLKGNKKEGYILSLKNSDDGFVFDESFTEPELLAIQKILNKKFPQNLTK